ncbi:MAG: BCAM0308 family protein [bacterium]
MAHNSVSGGKNFNEHYNANRVGELLRDPYITAKGLPEPSICPACNAVYHRKHWRFNDKLLAEAKKNKDVQYHKCPADRKIEDKYAMGKVSLTGSFVTEHMDELMNVIKSEERRAKENNPLDRLIFVDKRNGGIYAETTSDALAMRIGHHLKEAYKGGEENFKFRRGDKFVEIDWSRDL